MALPEPVKASLRYVRRVLKITDCWLSVVTGGDLYTTISYRAAVARASGSRFGCVLCRFLDLFQEDHCGIALREHDPPPPYL